MKQVVQYDLSGKYIKTWEGVREAGRQLNMFYQSIYKCCKGEYKTAYGYIWKYKEE